MAFPTTNWATLADATLSGGEIEKEAMGRFCERYWSPIAMMIRAKGAPAEKVEDLTQDFLVKLMESGFVRRAARERGTFRSFLLKALRDFLTDDFRKEAAIKRGGGLERVELREESATMNADELQFDFAWATTLFECAVEATGEQVKERRGEDGWLLLRAFITDVSEAVSLEELAKALHTTVGAAKTEVSRMRARFRENLRREVAQTVSAPHEVEEELAFLRDVLIKKQAGSNE